MKNTSNCSFTNRDLVRMLIPLLLEQVLSLSIGLADSVMVSSLGETAISAVSLVDTVNTLLVKLFAALAAGGSIVIGHCLGRTDHDQARRSAMQLIRFTLTVSVGVMLLLFLCRNLLFRTLFGAVNEKVRKDAVVYYNIVEPSIPFLALFSTGAALFRVTGDTKTPLILSAMMNIVNLGGNAVLLYGARWGIAGVALPTFFSRVFAAGAIMLMFLRRKSLPFALDFQQKPFFDGEITRQIIRISVPNGMESGVFQLGRVLLIRVVSTLGTSAISAYSIGNTFGALQLIAGDAVAAAMITVISYCVGAKDYDAVRQYTKKLLGIAYMLFFVINAILFPLYPQVLSWYRISEQTRQLTMLYIIVHAILSVLLWPASFLLPQTLRAAGDTRYSMFVSTVSMFLFRLLLGSVLAVSCSMGLYGIWLAIFVDWSVRIICFAVRYRGKRWQML